MSVGDLVDRVVIGIVARSQLGRRRIVRGPGKVGNLLASHIERAGKLLFLSSRRRDARLERGGKSRGVELFVQVRFNPRLIPCERRIELGSEFDGFSAKRQRIGRFELAQQRPIRIRGFLGIGQEEVRDGSVRSDATLLGRVGRTEGHRLEGRLHVRVAERLELGREHVDDIGVGAIDRERLPSGELLLGIGERLCIRGRGSGGTLALSNRQLRTRGELVIRLARAVGHLASNVLSHLSGRELELTRRCAFDGRVA